VSFEDDDYTLTERIKDLASAVACTNIVMCRLAQAAEDSASAQVAMDGVMHAVRADIGPTKAREVALTMAAKMTGQTEERLKDLFDSGLSSDEIVRIVKGDDDVNN
jgi:hypothetical protein